jgi:hypothetical protein
MFWIVLVADDDPAEVLEPGNEACELPAALIAPPRTTILGPRFSAAAEVPRSGLDPLIRTTFVERIAVIGLVAGSVIEAPQRQNARCASLQHG